MLNDRKAGVVNDKSPTSGTAVALAITCLATTSFRTQADTTNTQSPPREPITRTSSFNHVDASAAAVNGQTYIHSAAVFPTQSTQIQPTATPINSQTAFENKNKQSLWRNFLGGLGVASGLLGYVCYAVRSTPEDKRNKRLLSRLGQILFPREGFFPGDHFSMRVFATNHAVVLGIGAAVALTRGSGLLALAAPAAFLVGSVACYGPAREYGKNNPPSIWAKACEYFSYAGLAVFGYSKISALTSASTGMGANAEYIGIAAALLARSLTIIPFSTTYLNCARNAKNTDKFPQLKNLYLWLVASAFGAATLTTPLSAAAIIPIGYLVQNAVQAAVGTACYYRWKSVRNERIHTNECCED